MVNNPDYTNWCRNLFALLRNGGNWGVPRSHLTFTKRGQRFVLTKRAPYPYDEPHNEEMWQAYQQSDYEVIKLEFEKAGITVEDATSKAVCQECGNDTFADDGTCDKCSTPFKTGE